MRDMPPAVAHGSTERYWDKLRLDRVCAIAGARVADEIFDTAVNQGASVARKYLRSLNALNQRGTFYPTCRGWRRRARICCRAAYAFLRLRAA